MVAGLVGRSLEEVAQILGEVGLPGLPFRSRRNPAEEEVWAGAQGLALAPFVEPLREEADALETGPSQPRDVLTVGLGNLLFAVERAGP